MTEAESKPLPTPKGSTEETPTQEASAPPSFESIIASSKAKIAEEAAQQTKRGRGRPPGTGKHQKAAAEEKPAQASSVKPGAGETSAESAASVRNLTEELKPILRESVKVPFAFAAAKYGAPELEIDDKEADLPGFYLGRLLQLWMPDLEKQEPKTFNLYAFLIASALLVLKKLPLLVKRKNSMAAAEPTPEAPEAPAGASVVEADWRRLPMAPMSHDGRPGGGRTGF